MSEQEPSQAWQINTAPVPNSNALCRKRQSEKTGKGKPVITEREISLNGDESRREDYETFCIPNREADFGFHNFCKTAHQPYDEVVTAILCAALYLNCKGSDSIHSDGDFKEWYESGGIPLFQRAYEAVYREKVDDERLCGLLEKQIGDRDCPW